ncbi:MAG: hypothetical protein M3Y79_12460 [Pseudomonadota bacterium]|nr:hypothetical protein [Pseudomonadota bacterium]
MLLHPYHGVVHDARLYTIQALSHLHPELYGNDVFVRFGSQDDFTLFSPIYAWAITLVGVEPAAAIITFSSICLFLAATWVLARTILTTKQSSVALLLVVVVPTYYGAGRIFHVLEGFVSPRQLAEALTLFCLAAWLSNRRALGIVLAGCAMLIHPIIGLSGLVLVAMLDWILPHWRRLWPMALLITLVSTLALMDLLPISRWQFDAEWHEIVMRRTYLSMRYWNSDDWGRVAAVIATLTTASLFLEGNIRRLAIAGLATTVSLMLLALVGGDLLQVVVVVQAQPWRVLWLATLLAILLLPPLFVYGWRGNPLARCALLLIAAAWAAPYSTPALAVSPLAVVAAACVKRSNSPRVGLLLVCGATACLLTIISFSLATAILSLGEGLTRVESLPSSMDRILTFADDGVPPALVILGGAYIWSRFPSRMTSSALAGLLVLSIAALSIPTLGTWTMSRYNGKLHSAFAEWRNHIPPGSDVMWVGEESSWGDGATNTWLLLERPSFLSGAQAPNALFSRPAAIEMRNRAKSLWGVLPFADPFRPKKSNISEPPRPLTLAPVCQTDVVKFIVTQSTMVDATPIRAPAATPPHLRDYKLYICT